MKRAERVVWSLLVAVGIAGGYSYGTREAASTGPLRAGQTVRYKHPSDTFASDWVTRKKVADGWHLESADDGEEIVVPEAELRRGGW